MADVIKVLERARSMELEVSTQLEHIERLERIARRAHDSTAYAQQTVEKLARLEKHFSSVCPSPIARPVRNALRAAA